MSKSCPNNLVVQGENLKGQQKLSKDNLGNIGEIKEIRGKLSKSCPMTTQDNICEIENEQKKKVVQSCPRTTRDNIQKSNENTQICNRTQMSSEELDSNCVIHNQTNGN